MHHMALVIVLSYWLHHWHKLVPRDGMERFGSGRPLFLLPLLALILISSKPLNSLLALKKLLESSYKSWNSLTFHNPDDQGKRNTKFQVQHAQYCLLSVCRKINPALVFSIFSDINECMTNVHNCDVNAFCNDTDGSYNCTCISGFTGNGTSCTGKSSSQMHFKWPYQASLIADCRLN